MPRITTRLPVLFAALGAMGCPAEAVPPGADGGVPPGTDAPFVPSDAGPRPDGGPPPPPIVGCTAPVDLADVSVPDHLIGDGTAGSCTEAALRTAVAAGGTIAFDCGAAPVTITLGSALLPTADVTIDGGGTVTLSGGGVTRHVTIESSFERTSPHVWLQRLVLEDGHVDAVAEPGDVLTGGGGSVYYRGGRVTVVECTFRHNRAAARGPDVAGGAIYGIGMGETVVVRSTFEDNAASNGGAIGALGSGISITESTFHGNEASGFGANYVEGGVQMGLGGNGGALSMDGRGRDLVICGATFTANVSGAYGGAIFRTGYETETNDIHLSVFDGNSARDRRGGEEDLPSGAGALYLQGLDVRITRSTIANNRARSSAGLWVVDHGPEAPGRIFLENVTITGNATYERPDLTTRGVSAGVTIGGTTTGEIVNCTITGNAAQFGSGIWNASPLTIRNTIIANDAENVWTPLNCSGSMYARPSAMGASVVQWPTGMNPADDMDCISGVVRMDPEMGALGDHGGPVPTVLPGATGLPRGTDCPALDARGEPRDTADCTIGAVEL